MMDDVEIGRSVSVLDIVFPPLAQSVSCLVLLPEVVCDVIWYETRGAKGVILRIERRESLWYIDG